MEYAHDLDMVGDTVDDQVVGVDNDLAGVWHAAGWVEVGVLGEGRDSGGEELLQSPGGRRVLLGNSLGDGGEVG